MYPKNTKLYIFGSFLSRTDFKDIDVLVVVSDINEIERVNLFLSNIRDGYPNTLVHIQVYIQYEYLNLENKFNYSKVNSEISWDDLIELFKLDLN